MASGAWLDGRLPTERALAEHYGVARDTLRRALSDLEAQGLIRRAVGSGTFVISAVTAGSNDAPLNDEAILGMSSPAEVLECRLMFEPGIAALAVARATHEDCMAIESCLEKSFAAPTVADFEIWDAALHDALAVAAHNRPALAMVRTMASVRTRADWGRLKQRTMTAELRKEIHGQHASIVAALRNRDRQGAHDGMRMHLLHVRQYMFGLSDMRVA
ncbi:FadR family transcriptional regulator [Sphingomonas ginsenosidivorax]|uniref:FadR family transcriptional regulator n=1 Tax=Sphingomonas ginsenosidivorax TaxID=862135 RepID=A0A5C6U5D4_9SPHN|nr:FCD domain-containing protein [Sphingomonas ginsenosidivorax]TXC68009.1 FadR family transcriptional regulator [Sphingomonas ginsenosidivorax]